MRNEMTHEAGIEAAATVAYDWSGNAFYPDHEMDTSEYVSRILKAYLSASGMVLVPREEVPLHDRPTPKDYADRVQASELDCKEARRRHGINGTGPCQRCGFGTCQVYV